MLVSVSVQKHMTRHAKKCPREGKYLNIDNFLILGSQQLSRALDKGCSFSQPYLQMPETELKTIFMQSQCSNIEQWPHLKIPSTNT